MEPKLKRKTTMFDKEACSKEGKSQLIPCTFVADEDHEGMLFDKNDEIFTLSKATRKKILTHKCSYCTKSIGKRAEQHFCEFCGLQICQNCKRERRFPSQTTQFTA